MHCLCKLNQTSHHFSERLILSGASFIGLQVTIEIGCDVITNMINPIFFARLSVLPASSENGITSVNGNHSNGTICVKR